MRHLSHTIAAIVFATGLLFTVSSEAADADTAPLDGAIEKYTAALKSLDKLAAADSKSLRGSIGDAAQRFSAEIISAQRAFASAKPDETTLPAGLVLVGDSFAVRADDVPALFGDLAAIRQRLESERVLLASDLRRIDTTAASRDRTRRSDRYVAGLQAQRTLRQIESWQNKQSVVVFKGTDIRVSKEAAREHIREQVQKAQFYSWLAQQDDSAERRAAAARDKAAVLSLRRVDGSMRQMLAGITKEMQRIEPTLLERCERDLGATEVETRVNAVARLMEMSDKRVATLIKQALRDEAVAVRVAAIESAAMSPVVSLVPLLNGALSDPSPEVRAAAVRWIDTLAEPAFERTIQQLLRRRDDATKQAVLQAIPQWNLAPGQREILAAAPDPQVRLATYSLMPEKLEDYENNNWAAWAVARYLVDPDAGIRRIGYTRLDDWCATVEDQEDKDRMIQYAITNALVSRNRDVHDDAADCLLKVSMDNFSLTTEVIQLMRIASPATRKKVLPYAERAVELERYLEKMRRDGRLVD